MFQRTLLISLSLLVLLCACGGPGDSATVPKAEPAGVTFSDLGEHVVHFNAQTTDQLPRQFATQYNLVRSDEIAMLSVSVIRKSDNVPVNADVTVKAVNLTGQLKNFDMRKIEESGEVTAIYYIGDDNIRNRETLVFDISVKPDGEDRVSEVRFKRQFYSD